MKIYCFSDYHNEKEFLPEMRRKAKTADIIISAGDHSIFEYEQGNILKEFNNWNKPFYIIHGNHEDEKSLQEACKKYKNIHFIHAQETLVHNIRLLAWGGGGFSAYDKALEKKVSEWKKSEHNKTATLLITHAPPYKTTLDEKDPGWHVGNKSIKKAIKQLAPIVALSGHIHEAAGATQTLGTTVCYNLGIPGRILDI